MFSTMMSFTWQQQQQQQRQQQRQQQQQVSSRSSTEHNWRKHGDMIMPLQFTFCPATLNLNLRHPQPTKPSQTKCKT
jgi:hypothetical protein